jgi:hypothetical protein
MVVSFEFFHFHNLEFDAGNDPVQRALRRIRVRQAEVRHFCIGAIHDPTSPGDSVISDLERKIVMIRSRDLLILL